jgi:hypothetical protein
MTEAKQAAATLIFLRKTGRRCDFGVCTLPVFQQPYRAKDPEAGLTVSFHPFNDCCC